MSNYPSARRIQIEGLTSDRTRSLLRKINGGRNRDAKLECSPALTSSVSLPLHRGDCPHTPGADDHYFADRRQGVAHQRPVDGDVEPQSRLGPWRFSGV